MRNLIFNDFVKNFETRSIETKLQGLKEMMVKEMTMWFILVQSHILSRVVTYIRPLQLNLNIQNLWGSGYKLKNTVNKTQTILLIEEHPRQ